MQTPGLRVLPYKAGSADSERIQLLQMFRLAFDNERDEQSSQWSCSNPRWRKRHSSRPDEQPRRGAPSGGPSNCTDQHRGKHGQKRRSSNFQQSLQPVRDKEAEGKSASMRFDRNAEVNVFNQCPRVDGDQICNSCVRRELSCYWPCRRCRRINKKV